MKRPLRELSVDVAWGLAWAALLTLAVLFSAGASDFIYVDF